MKFKPDELFSIVVEYYFGDFGLNQVSVILHEMRTAGSSIYFRDLSDKTGFSGSEIVHYFAASIMADKENLSGENLYQILLESLDECKAIVRAPSETALERLKVRLPAGRKWLEQSYREGQRRLQEEESDCPASLCPKEFLADQF